MPRPRRPRTVGRAWQALLTRVREHGVTQRDEAYERWLDGLTIEDVQRIFEQFNKRPERRRQRRRHHLAHVIACAPPATLQHTAESPDGSERVTLGYLMEDYVRHMRHHFDQIQRGLRA